MYKTLQQCLNTLDGIQAIDYYLSRQILQSLNCPQDELLLHSIIAVSEALRNGHTCLKLSAQSDTPYWQNISELPDESRSGYSFPDIESWHQHLKKLPIAADDNQPLVYEQQRLYLRRYWQFEQELSNAIRSLITKTSMPDMSQAKGIIAQLFPQSTKSELPDWQKIAVANALIHPFSIIAGGPGTGKTFTVTKILAALQSLSDNSLKIAMIAPTGKAAQRLNESIQKAKSVLHSSQLCSEATLQSIPDSASTLHRLLGVIPGSHDFRHNQSRPLVYDVVLVDEISMIDLPLMTRLLRAVKEGCRIIMLGDADQLPSVAAGSVLADLAPRQPPGYSPVVSQQLSKLTGFSIPLIEDDMLALDHLCVLQKSHRFDGKGEIGRLAGKVIAGKTQQSWDLLQQGTEQIELVKDTAFKLWLEHMVQQYYVPLFANSMEQSPLSISQAFKQLSLFRFLLATRLGEQGVSAVNELIEQYLRSNGCINTASDFYPGRPIMVTENHYTIGLYNGDTGLLWPNEQGKLQAAFPDNDTVRWLSLGRLPKVETVYAMTIHKTQGSEFSHVGLIMPEQDCQILSRELLYTGITRASNKLSVWAGEAVWKTAVRRKVQRYSGLRERVFDTKS